MEIDEELRILLQNLEREGVPYALCGGLALAVYGIIRATEDIDLLVEEASVPRIRTVAGALGFRLNPTPFIFKSGDIKIFRLFKAAGEDLLVLDLLIMSPATSSAWESRRRVETDFGSVHVVSPAGLVHLKSLRGSGQDEDDIRKLKELRDES